MFINTIVGGETAEELKNIPGWEQLNLTTTTYSGKCDFKVSSGFEPTSLLTFSVDQIVESASKFKIEGDGNFEEFNHLIMTVKSLIKGLLPEDKKTNMAMAAVTIMTTLRNFGLEFKYDPNVVKEVLKDLLLASGKADKAQEFLSGNQEMATKLKMDIPLANGL